MGDGGGARGGGSTPQPHALHGAAAPHYPHPSVTTTGHGGSVSQGDLLRSAKSRSPQVGTTPGGAPVTLRSMGPTSGAGPLEPGTFGSGASPAHTPGGGGAHPLHTGSTSPSQRSLAFHNYPSAATAGASPTVRSFLSPLQER